MIHVQEGKLFLIEQLEKECPSLMLSVEINLENVEKRK